MYGIVNGDNAMMVVCTEGDSNAKLTASVSGQSKSSFNVCGFDFTVRDSDTYYMSGDNGTALTVFEDGDMKTDTLAVRYLSLIHIYGLPLTRSWAMMFYRKDVLSELGFTQAPQTWEELIDMLPALQRSYMSAGLVLPAVAADANQATISAATESGLTFASLRCV